ncbi:MAG: lysozyme inhibitor LprI family protein [Pseudomonadota bacterium]|nr:lysozyme inhibitor LprI family protein [Pseudomonadota bacterium]MEE3098146.1 lysozyme inhibitor LprI family protein [Pseudomonadota bacterium]
MPRPRLPSLLPAAIFASLAAIPAQTSAGEKIPAPSLMQGEIEACLDAAAAAGGDPDGAGARACIGRETEACVSRPENQTTNGMAACALAERDAWDALLNSWWKPLRARALKLDEAAGDDAAPAAAPALLEAQRAWLAFRDAECAYDDALGGGGTIRRIHAAGCLMRLTAERALRFRERLAAEP